MTLQLVQISLVACPGGWRWRWADVSLTQTMYASTCHGHYRLQLGLSIQSIRQWKKRNTDDFGHLFQLSWSLERFCKSAMCIKWKNAKHFTVSENNYKKAPRLLKHTPSDQDLCLDFSKLVKTWHCDVLLWVITINHALTKWILTHLSSWLMLLIDKPAVHTLGVGSK